MNKKEIVNVNKRPDGIFEIECFEKPLRTQIAELEQENKQLKEQLQEQIDYKDEYYHYWQEAKKEQRKNKQIRHQVCDEIREKLKKQIIPTAGTWLSYYDIKETNDLLDQIEKGE